MKKNQIFQDDIINCTEKQMHVNNPQGVVAPDSVWKVLKSHLTDIDHIPDILDLVHHPAPSSVQHTVTPKQTGKFLD